MENNTNSLRGTEQKAICIYNRQRERERERERATYNQS